MTLQYRKHTNGEALNGGAVNGDALPAGKKSLKSPTSSSSGDASNRSSWLARELDYWRNMLPGLDNAWLLLTGGHRNAFAPTCTSIFTFADEIDFDALVQTWDEMGERYPAYRSVLVGRNRHLHTARLIPSEDFDIRQHVTSMRLASGATGKQALEEAMAALAARPWDLDRPLWDAQVIYGYEDETGAKSALITRAHHTLSDGQGFVLSTLSMTSGREMLEGKLKSIAETENALARGSGKLSDLPPAKKLKAWDTWVPSLLVALLYWAGVLWHAVIGGLFGSAEVLRVLWYYLTFRPKANRYPGPRSSTKEFSFSEAVDLKDIKVVQKAFSVPGRHITLNDVMCAVVARAMIEHYAAVGAPTDPRISLFIPISIRALDDFSLGNQSTGLIAHLPAEAVLSTRQLIHSAHDVMLGLKSSFWPALFFRAIQWMFRAPVLFPGPDNFILADMLTSFHAVFTNIPGPSAEIHMAGSKVLRWTASPPQAGKGVLAIGVISYNGHLIWTVTTDKVEGPLAGMAGKLTAAFERTFAQFLEEARTLAKQ